MKRSILVSCLFFFCVSAGFSQITFGGFGGGYGSVYDDYDDDYDEDEYDDDEYDDYEDEEEEDEQQRHEAYDEVEFIYNKTRAGDQFLKITLAANVPLSFGNPWFTANGKMKIGGLGTIGYHYFLSDHFAIGADVGFGFNTTIGGNIFNHVPIIISATFQPAVNNFEFPISMGIGMAWETLNEYTYWPGLIIKPEVGVHYRRSSGWSVGGDVSYTVMPQLGKVWDTGKKDVYAKFFTVSATLIYYF